MFFASTLPAYADAKAGVAQSSSAHITRLKNGLTVYILPDARFPLLSTRLFVKTGAARETPQEAGISHLLEHMVFKGTHNRPNDETARQVEAVGGYLNAGTSFDYTVYLTDMPAAHWALGMDVVKDMAFNATLDPQDLTSEKDVVLAELARGKDNPSSRIFEELQAHALKGTPYERPIIGYAETIRAISQQNMRDYIVRYYQPQNMLLVLVGQVDPSAALAEAERLFGGLTNSASMSTALPLDPQTLGGNAHVTVQPGPWNKVYLGMALPVPGDQDVRSLTLDVLAHILGGDATSYLHHKYKYEKRLVDTISVNNYSFDRVGMLYVTVHLDADKVAPFWKEFVADMATLKATAFSQESVSRAKLQMEDALQRVKETLAGLASWKGQLMLFHGGEQAEANSLNSLRAVDHAQLQEAMDMWLRPERLSVVVLPPKDAVLPDLRAELLAAWPATPIQQTAHSAATGTLERVDLGHGRTLVLIPDTTMPYTSVDIAFTGGDSLLPPANQGLASLAARALTSGAAGRDAPAVERYLADRAASLGATAGRQTFMLSARMPARFSAQILTLLRETLSAPNFAPEEISREKNNQIAAIRARDDRALGLAFAEMPPFLFPGGHPYGYRSLGSMKDVEEYTPSQVRSFWDKQVRQPWVLAVAGEFDREAVIAFARSLPVPKDKSAKIDAPAWTQDSALALTMPERQQAHLMLVFKTVPMTHEDAAGLELLQNALAGQSGLLFRELRNKQALGYTVTAFNSHFAEAGYMVFYIGTEPSKLRQARAGFDAVLAQLSTTPLPEDEVIAAQNQMDGEYYRQRQRLSSRSSEAATLGILGLDLDFRKDRIAEAKKKNTDDLRALVQKYLKPDGAYVVTIAP